MSRLLRRAISCFIARSAAGAIVIALNLGAEPGSISSSSIGAGRENLLSTRMDRQGERIESALELHANEGAMLGTPAHDG
jgi:alpha-glucosidase